MTRAANKPRFFKKNLDEVIVSDIENENILKCVVAKSNKNIRLDFMFPPIPSGSRKLLGRRPVRGNNQDWHNDKVEQIISHKDYADIIRYVGDDSINLDSNFFAQCTLAELNKEYFYKPMKDYLDESRYGREANEDIGLDEDQPPMPDSVYENALKLLDDCFRILSWNMDVDPDNGEVVFGSRDCKGNVRLLANNKISFYINYKNRYLSNEMEFSVCAVDNIITFWEAANDERK